MKCVIAGPDYIADLGVRYCGIGKELTPDETQILLFSLWAESQSRGDGIANNALRICDKRAAGARVIKP